MRVDWGSQYTSPDPLHCEPRAKSKGIPNIIPSACRNVVNHGKPHLRHIPNIQTQQWEERSWHLVHQCSPHCPTKKLTFVGTVWHSIIFTACAGVVGPLRCGFRTITIETWRDTVSRSRVWWSDMGSTPCGLIFLQIYPLETQVSYWIYSFWGPLLKILATFIILHWRTHFGMRNWQFRPCNAGHTKKHHPLPTGWISSSPSSQPAPGRMRDVVDIVCYTFCMNNVVNPIIINKPTICG